MKQKSTNLLELKSWLNRGRQHFSTIPLLIWLNILIVIILILLSIYAKVQSKGDNIEILFSDPFSIGIFYLGWLTGISEILWGAAIAICIFTSTTLPNTLPNTLPKSNHKFKFFLSVSAAIMSLLYLDDRFRITLILCVFFGSYRLVKITVYSIYGLLLIGYALWFRKTIRTTPYIPLLIAFCLFGFSSAIDITPISSRGIHAMLEDGTKLIGLTNLTVYFSYICQQQIKKSIF